MHPDVEAASAGAQETVQARPLPGPTAVAVAEAMARAGDLSSPVSLLCRWVLGVGRSQKPMSREPLAWPALHLTGMRAQTVLSEADRAHGG